MSIKALFDPGELPAGTSAGLLILRVWSGLTMLLWHGWSKFTNFDEISQRFPDLLNIGSGAVNLALSLSAEAGCSTLLALGLFTRLAAVPLVVNMAVAFALAHDMRLSGVGNGELSFVYLGVFITILVAGPGRYSLDFRWFTSAPESADVFTTKPRALTGS